MMLRHSFGRENEARAIEIAVAEAIRDGARTPDLGGSSSTGEMTEAVLSALSGVAMK
jgi:Isocitrate/isopropylmalate dehydrogenase